MKERESLLVFNDLKYRLFLSFFNFVFVKKKIKEKILENKVN